MLMDEGLKRWRTDAVIPATARTTVWQRETSYDARAAVEKTKQKTRAVRRLDDAFMAPDDAKGRKNILSLCTDPHSAVLTNVATQVIDRQVIGFISSVC